MDMSNYVQPNCINGVSKEDAENVKEIPQIMDDLDTLDSRVDGMEDDIEILDNRVTTLEENSGSKDWELYDGTDWSQFSTDGKANQELLIKIVSYVTWSVGTTNHNMPTCGTFIHIKKGDVFSNTDIEDNDIVFPFFEDTQSGSYYYRGLGNCKYITKGVSGNTALLTSENVKMQTKGSMLYITGSSSSQVTSSQIMGVAMSNTRTLVKNGNGDHKIFLYYRPTE